MRRSLPDEALAGATVAPRWLARVARVGLDRDGHHWGRHLLARLVELLPGAPIGFWVQDGRLRHPPGRLERRDLCAPDHFAGVVTAAHEDGRAAYAEFMLGEDALGLRVQRGLERLELDGRLPRQGVSLALGGFVTTEPRVLCGRPTVQILGFSEVRAVDLVTYPAADGACVLRSIAPRTTEEEITR